jgi:hypothetical protein
MRFPIDTSGLRFVVVAAGEPLRCYEEGKPHDAWPLRRMTTATCCGALPLVALGDDAGEVLRVTVAGDPEVEPGGLVTVEDMTALTWTLDGRSNVSLRARSITARADLAVVKGG